jgi:hypothetical protein
MVGIHPPVMTLMGLPWGPLDSWDAAGKCFVTLTAVTSLLAAACFYLLLRIGVKPSFLVIAGVCVVASLGPWPPGARAHAASTAFLADSLLGWTALTAVLLIPYEARTRCPSVRGAVLRGVSWASILSLGAITKVSFFYFIVLIVPALFLIRSHHSGSRSALTAVIAFVCWSAPASLYFMGWGQQAIRNAGSTAFGRTGSFYREPLLEFLGTTVRESPGTMLWLVAIAGALIYVLIGRRAVPRVPDWLAFLIVVGFGIVVLAGDAKMRYGFPVIVPLPFLAAILISGRAQPAPGRSAVLAAALVFVGLFAAGLPMWQRPDRQSLSRPDAVLVQAARCHMQRILLATDSPTLNWSLMSLAMEISTSPAPLQVSTLAYSGMLGTPMDEDFRGIDESDQVVFQDRGALSPPFTNQRVPEYERYVRQRGYVPVRVGEDVSVYSVHCNR